MTLPVDTAIVSAIAIGAIFGLAGVSRLFSPLAFFLAITATISIYPRLVEVFGRAANGGARGPVHVMSFLAAFLLALVGFGLLNRSLSAAVKLSKLQAGDRILGVATGMVLAAFLAGGLANAAGLYGGSAVREALATSQFAPLIAELFRMLSGWVEHLLPPLNSAV
jgi:uncharacterized membrane protein required for colicin V production